VSLNSREYCGCLNSCLVHKKYKKCLGASSKLLLVISRFQAYLASRPHFPCLDDRHALAILLVDWSARAPPFCFCSAASIDLLVAFLVDLRERWSRRVLPNNQPFNMRKATFSAFSDDDDDDAPLMSLRKRTSTSYLPDEGSSSSDCEVYEPVKHAPDVILISSDESCESSEEDDSDCFSSDEEWSDSKLNKGKKKIRVGQVTIEAFCVDVEDDGARPPVKDERPDACGAVDENIKIRIRKMLQVGLHPGTPNEEAERSLKIAHSLLQKHNLEEMDVVNAGGADGKTKLTGGMKVVELKSKSGNTPNNAAWMCKLGGAASACFDCCYFTESTDNSLNYVFYGVAANAEMAAFAFSSSLNRVAHMTAAYTGVEGGRHVNMAVARANYRDGLVSGLSKAVQEEQRERVRAAKEQDRLRQLELQARREAKLAKARAEQEIIDKAAAAAGIDPSEIKRAADATYSDDEDEVAEADGDRLWQAKSESQAVKQEKSESHALTVLHVKCEEVAQEVRFCHDSSIAFPTAASLV
jgi:hypothetical protein